MEEIDRTVDEASLLADLIAGKEQALSAVIRTIVPDLLKSLHRQFPGTDFASLEDAMSVALMRLWQNRGHLQSSGGNLRSWLYVVARNDLMDQFRANAHNPQAVDNTTLEHHANANNAPGGREPIEHRKDSFNNNLHLLQRALQSFSVMDQRILLEGTATPDDWTRDISKGTQMTPNAIRVRRHRLLVRLRNQLSTMGDDMKGTKNGNDI
jgi:RNA polymerase sigma factor (sigma-70 family)